MSKPKHHTLNQRVYQRLQGMLLRGEIPLGAQLDERALATQLEVSRTPLREAIAQLVRENMVEYRPYRGNFVRTFTSRQARDLYLVRKSLESLAIRLAIPKLSLEDIDRVRAILTQVNEALEANDMNAFADADRRFHQFFIQASQNETLIHTLNRLGAQIQMVRTIANRDQQVVQRTLHERPRILAAIEARDAYSAARLMEEHIDGVCQAVVSHLEELEALGQIDGELPHWTEEL